MKVDESPNSTLDPPPATTSPFLRCKTWDARSSSTRIRLLLQFSVPQGPVVGLVFNASWSVQERESSKKDITVSISASVLRELEDRRVPLSWPQFSTVKEEPFSSSQTMFVTFCPHWKSKLRSFAAWRNARTAAEGSTQPSSGKKKVYLDLLWSSFLSDALFQFESGSNSVSLEDDNRPSNG